MILNYMLSIGNILLPGNLVLSPMAGVTDAPFRQIARECGADYTISEMLSSDVELWSTTKSQIRLNDKWSTYPKILQIAGASPTVISNAAILCESMQADIIEINMGCPAKKVCNVLAGSALLQDEALVKDIIKATCRSVNIPVTLKTRLGWDDNRLNILNIAKIAEDNGIKGITIHGRTRMDMYNNNARYDLIAQVKQNISIPVFANGDILTPEDAKYVLDYTMADGIYIGRGSLGKPWLFSMIKEYLASGQYHGFSNTQKIQIIKRHIGYIHEHYPYPLNYRFARKHIKWYFTSLGLNEKLFKSISSLECIDLQKHRLNEILGSYLNKVTEYE